MKTELYVIAVSEHNRYTYLTTKYEWEELGLGFANILIFAKYEEALSVANFIANTNSDYNKVIIKKFCSQNSDDVLISAV